MKAFYSMVQVAVLLFALSPSIYGQELVVAPKPNRNLSKTEVNNPTTPVRPEKCGFSFVMEKARKKGFSDETFETNLKKLIANKMAANGRFTGPVTLPVIFHLIYRNGEETPSNTTANLTAAKIQAQLNQLNLDYSNQSGSTWGAAEDVQIQFCLALVDTTGRVLNEPGINRINGQAKGWPATNGQTIDPLIATFDGTIKPQSIWNPYEYVNIWIAAMNSSGLLGYATFPSMSTLSGLDDSETDLDAGVVINWQSVGSVASPGTSISFGYGRTLTHELGHFFGLRHITGDALCGNDYCNDTPPQDDLTSGCPASPQANGCTPVANKMFENYMDYSNDACLNTFTTDQAIRSQTVMDNSPRRVSLLSSTVCMSRPVNAIAFARSTPLVISETGSGAACPKTVVIPVNLYVSQAATANATVTLAISGTATQGQDYTISPSTLNYTNGDNTAKTITITIIDDASIESTETIVLNYTISGAGVVAGIDKQTYTIQVIDNDISNKINHPAAAATIFSENFQASTNIPAGWDMQAFSVSTPANQWVVSTNGGSTFGTTTNVAHITQNTSTKPNTYNITNPSDAYLITPLIDATGLNNLTISFKYRCRGEVDGTTVYDAGYIGYVPEGGTDIFWFTNTFVSQNAVATFNGNLPTGMNNSKFYFVFNWENDESVGTNPGFTIDDIVFTGKSIGVETVAGQTITEPINIGNETRLITTVATNSNIIASISNANQNIGCLTASVQTAGNGRINATLNGTATLRTQKVFRLSPATANTTANYDLALYFTTAELAAWGGDFSNLRLLKLPEGPIMASNNYTDVFTFPIDEVQDNTATGGYYKVVISGVTDGFSDFALIEDEFPLPITLVDFVATPVNRTIVLNWATTIESNNKGYAIERSTDGQNFVKIGWKDAIGNSFSKNNYSFTDRNVQPGIVYQYRIRQIDLNNRESLSTLRQAAITESGIAITLSPNPASRVVNLFISGATARVDINLVNSNGQIVKKWKNVNSTDTTAPLDITGLAAGIYIVEIQLPTEKLVRKLVIH